MNRKTMVIRTFLTGTVLLMVIFVTLSYLKSSEHSHESTDKVQVGVEVPDFEMTGVIGSVDSQSVYYLSEFKGKLVILNFWATWCSSCLIEMPSLQSLQEKYKAEGLELIALSVDENPNLEVPELLKKQKWKLRIVSDSKQIASQIFKVEGLPTTAVISRDGKLLDLIVGEQDWMSLDIQKQVKKWLQ